MGYEQYYPCPFCPRGQFLLEFLYIADQNKRLYNGKCDKCGAEFSILFPKKKE